MQRVGIGIALFSMLIFAVSCESSSSPSQNFPFPLQKGTYWIYTVVQLDTAGNPMPDSEILDSATVKGSAVIEGKEATQINHYATDTTWVEFVRVSPDQYATYGIPIQNLPLGPGLSTPRWMIIADYTRSQWTVLDTTLNNVSLSVPNLGTVLLSGSISITGHRSGGQRVTLNGKTYDATIFMLQYTVDLDAQFTAGGQTRTGKIQRSFAQRFWFAAPIGLVMSEAATTVLTLEAPSLSLPLATIPGSRSTLLRFHIAQ